MAIMGRYAESIPIRNASRMARVILRKQQYSNEGTMLYSNEEGDEQKSMLPNNSIIIAPEN